MHFSSKFTEQRFDEEKVGVVLSSQSQSARGIYVPKNILLTSNQCEVFCQTCYSDVGKCGIFRPNSMQGLI